MRTAVRDHHTRLLIASSRPSNLDDISDAHLRLLPGEEAHLLSALTAPDHIAASDAPLQAEFLKSARAALDSATSVTLFLGTEFLRTGAVEETLDWITHTVNFLENAGKTVAVQILFDRPNQRGLWDMGCLPGLRPGGIVNETAPALTARSGTGSAPVPDMVFVAGADPLTDCATGDRCGTAARKTDFLVVQSAHVNATTEHADVLLPCPAWGEETGTFTSNQGATQPLQMIRPPAPEVLSARQLYQRIATAMGLAPDTPDAPAVIATDLTPGSAAHIAPTGRTDAGTPPATLPPALNGNADSAAASVTEGTPARPPAPRGARPPEPGAGQFRLITGASLFSAGTLSARSHLLQNLERGAYLELNPPEGLEPEAHQYQVTLRSGSTTLSAPLKVNRGFARDVVYAPESLFAALEDNPLSARNYPLAVTLTFARLP
jgi:NADH-quinone oxidoreductase subunit G